MTDGVLFAVGRDGIDLTHRFESVLKRMQPLRVNPIVV
jgi:hypothetical protein